MVAGKSGCGELCTAGAGRVVSRLTRLTLVAAALALTACTQTVLVRPADEGVAPPPARPSRSGSAPAYTVQAGDTLYKISVQYGVDYRELASWNNIGAPYTIYPNQTLQVGPDSAPPAQVASDRSPPPATSSRSAAPSFTSRAAISCASTIASTAVNWRRSTPK